MKKKVVIFYEHKARELEFAYLLKLYLEHLKLKVEIQHLFNLPKIKYIFFRPKIIVLPGLYDEETYKLCKRNLIFKAIIINLRYEQIFPNYVNNVGYQYNSEILNKAYNLIWGNNSYKEIKRHGVKDENILRYGHPILDFCHTKKHNYYFEKEFIANELGLNIEKKWILFVSSLAITEDSETNHLDLSLKYGFEEQKTLDYFRLVIKSRNKIISDLLRLSRENNHYEIIYRPHPAEGIKIEALKNLGNFNNFHVISEMSLRQWVYVSDFIINWQSTSLFEISQMGKNFITYRPYKIQPDWDYSYMRSSQIYSNYSDLMNAIDNSQSDNIINFEEFYDIPNIPVFKNLGDFILELQQSSENVTQFKYNFDDLKIFIKFYISFFINRFSRLTNIRFSKIFSKHKNQLESIENSKFGINELPNPIESKILKDSVKKLFKHYISNDIFKL